MLTSVQHWDVMTCEIRFEIWHPSNKQKFICMDGLTQPLFKDRLRPFKWLTYVGTSPCQRSPFYVDFCPTLGCHDMRNKV